MIATEISDVLFGTPKTHGFQSTWQYCRGPGEPQSSTGTPPGFRDGARAAQDPKLLARAQALGAKVINLPACAAPATRCSCARASPCRQPPGPGDWP